MPAPEPTTVAVPSSDEIQRVLAYLAVSAGAAAPIPGGAAAQACPTVAEYSAKVVAAVKSTSADTYDTHWRQLVGALGSRRLDEVRTSDLAVVAREARENALVRRNSGSGIGAEENCVSAMRCFFALAVADRHLVENPALGVRKPRRQESERTGLTEAQLREVYRITAGGENDPHLDLLLVRFHLETGARRGGAIALRLCDLDDVNQRIRLREKGDTRRWQPVSRTLLVALAEHAAIRGATAPEDSVLRYRPTKSRPVGSALTRRRYNTLADRWQQNAKDPALSGVSIHGLRHTAISSVERLAGFAVARAFAGHGAGGETTTTYIKASQAEVARAVALMTGEPHPLAPSVMG